MSNPTVRVLTVLELLQTHGRISGTELARRLAVDVRTVRRYISALEELGIPVTAEQGRYGGYYLVAGFKLPPMMFTNEETLAISLGLLAARSLGLAEAAPAIESAQAKLERVMPGKLKRQIRAMHETTVLELPRANPLGSIGILADLSAAARDEQRVSFIYEAWDGATSTREFDPYGLVFRRGYWYAGGYCHLRKSLRTFRLDRIQTLRVLERSFVRPADFNVAQHLSLAMASLPRKYPVVVRLHTEMNTAMETIGDEVGLLVPERNDVLLHTRTDCLEWFARQLTRLPFAFSVEKPDELREEVRSLAARLLEHNAEIHTDQTFIL